MARESSTDDDEAIPWTASTSDQSKKWKMTLQDENRDEIGKSQEIWKNVKRGLVRVLLLSIGKFHVIYLSIHQIWIFMQFKRNFNWKVVRLLLMTLTVVHCVTNLGKFFCAEIYMTGDQGWSTTSSL